MAAALKANLMPVLLVGLSLSIGWGIRDNYGHEHGAMIPGALAGLAAALLAGRRDWYPRCAFFAFFGALGWSFGGSISYMQVIAYTHSGHSGSVLYGFACLFVIGFLWAAMGGAGTALPACLDRDALTEFFVPLTAIFGGWILQDLAVARWFAVDSDYRQASPLYWYDTNWVAVLVAIAAVLVIAAVRRRLDRASSLILHIAIGWWVGFLVLVNLLGWRMTPPRGDNWAGCLGMVVGMWVYFQRKRLFALTFASLVAGLIGGLGFAGANSLKLIGIATGWQTNWHSLLEQSYGLINGVGLGMALLWLARFVPEVTDEPRVRRWTEIYAVAFVLLVVTYLNLQQNPAVWVKAKAMPSVLLGLSAESWFNLAYAAAAVGFAAVVVAQRRQPLPLLSVGWPVRGQLLYLVFLWWIVIGNFERALVAFAPQRLVTEGVILLNAVICTVGVINLSGRAAASPIDVAVSWRRLVSRTAAVGLAVASVCVVADWALIRAVYGNAFAGYAGRHIRFGPDRTASTEKPAKNSPHP
jgi:hypothetical protein